MALPKRPELRFQFMKVLEDGNWHTHEEIAGILAKQNGVSEQELAAYRGSGYQSELENEMNWIKGHELQTTWGLVQYQNGNTHIIGITEDGKRVMKADPPGKLEYDFIRKVLNRKAGQA
jgi:hypothetical protein